MDFFKADKRLEEKGWKKMADLLDKEMPVGENRNRNPLAWLFLGLMLLLGGIIGYGLGRIEQKKLDEADAPASSASLMWQKKQGKDAHYSIQPAVIQNQFKITSRNPENFSFGLPQFAVSQTYFVPYPLYFPLKTLNSKSQGEVGNSQAEAPLKTANEDKISVLPVASPQAVSALFKQRFSPAQAEASARPVKIIKKRKALHYGMSIGASTEQWRDINGLSAGALVDWNFSRKWGLRSGASYSRFLPTISSQPLVKVYDWDYTAATGDYSVAKVNQPWGTGTNLDPYVIIPVNRIHKVELPLMVYWQPIKRLKTLAGLNLGYVVYAESASHNFSDDQILRINEPDLEKRVNKLATEALQQWQTGAVTGIAFRPLKCLEIGATYNRLIDFQNFSSNFNYRATNTNLAKYSELNFGGAYRPQQIFTFNTTLFF